MAIKGLFEEGLQIYGKRLIRTQADCNFSKYKYGLTLAASPLPKARRRDFPGQGISGCIVVFRRFSHFY
jgi:hypothetical protein